MKMVILIMAIWMLLILILLFFFAKPNGSIHHLVGDESAKKRFLILCFMFILRVIVDTSINDEDMCLIDSATTHTILKSNNFFSFFVIREVNVSTVFGTINIIKGYRRAIMLLPRGTRLHIKNAFYSPKSYRNLSSFKDILLNGYHSKTNNEGDIKYLYITRIESNKKCVFEKLSIFPYGLYYTYTNAIETHVIVS